MKKDDNNNASSRDGQSPAANPVAQISKLPSGKKLAALQGARIWHGVMLLGSRAQSVGLVVAGSVLLGAHP